MEAPNHCGGRRMGAGVGKDPKNVKSSTFFNTVHLLPKDLSFEHGGAKLASCPGRHLTSLRLCLPSTVSQLASFRRLPTALCSSAV